jgi:hypothetical protein
MTRDTHIHVLHEGRPLCRFSPELPRDWPEGHACISASELPRELEDPQSPVRALMCKGCLEAFEAATKTLHVNRSEAMPPVLCLWTIYDHPKDYPNAIVARKYDVNANGTTATGDVRLFANVELARQTMREMGLTRITRDPSDDPVIVETWL